MKTPNSYHPNRNTLKHLALAQMMAAANAMMLGSADAAPISWNPIQNATGNASDVVATGTFFDSAAAYPTADVALNGVTFRRHLGNGTFAGSGITWTNLQSGSVNAGNNSPPVTWDANYQKLADYQVYRAAPASITINLNNLLVDKEYLVQIWTGYWDNANYQTQFTAGNSSGFLNIGSTSASRLSQYVVGSFTADATTQTILATGATSGYAMPSFMQVRTVEIAPPPTPANLAATPYYAKVDLTWADAPGATGYKVKRAPAIDGTYEELLPAPSTTTFTDATVAPATTYYYKVAATNPDGESAYSDAVEATTWTALQDQTITFTLGLTVSKPWNNSAFADGATATSGLTVTYSSDNVAVATVDASGTVTLTGVLGTANILANQPGDANFNPAPQVSQELTVTKATPVITWNEPAPITVGTALGSTQLNATSGGVAGDFVYTPAIGTVLARGSHDLSVQFTPTESTLYDTPAAKQVTLLVSLPPWINVNFDNVTQSGLAGPLGGQGTTWNTIPLAAGTTSNLLSSSSATTTVGVTRSNGGATWSSPSLAMLIAGLYVGNGGTGTVTITGLPAGMNYDLYIGSYYSAGGSNASFSTTNVTSTVGAQSCDNGGPNGNGTTWVRGVNYVAFHNIQPDTNNKITFTFTGTGGYAMVNGLQLAENPAPVPPPTPANLAATPYYAKVDLTWAHAPGATGYKVKRADAIDGTYTELLPAPSTTTFTDATVAPATTYYYKVAATNPDGASADSDPVAATTWTAPHDQTITFDLGLTVSKPWNNSAFADGATATSGLTVIYSSDNESVATVDASGTVTLTGVPGTANILANQPGDANFNPAPQVSQELTVTKATPVITWNNPAPITVGTALDSTQLNATSGGVAGDFVYTPAIGTVLARGSHDLSVQFTPTESTLYDTPAAKQVTLFVSLPPWINVNFTDGSETGLEGPIGGAGLVWNQQALGTSGVLVDSVGVTTGTVNTNTPTPGTVIANWVTPDPALTVLKAGYFQFGKGADFTVTISGLQAGGGYDLLVLTRSNGTGTESDFGTFRTSNTNASGDQVIDSRSAYNGTTWVQGQNYALFESIIADGSGNISFTSDGHDPNEIDPNDADSYRLMVNGLQLVQTSSPPVLAYSTWANANNATGQTPDQDHDNDGVDNGIEYFMGETGSSFTAMPGLDGDNKVTWPMDPDYAGTYEVQTSSDLVTWTNVVDPRPTPSGGSLSYTLPADAPGGKSFVRLLVTPAP